MAGDDDVGEGEHPRKDVVLDDAIGEVLEEQIAFFEKEQLKRTNQIQRL